MKKKIVASVAVALLVLNLILFGAGMIDPLTFWIVIGAGFLIVKFALPHIE